MQSRLKKVKTRAENVNKSLKYIATVYITVLKELINVGAKLVGDKIVIPKRNSKRSTKPRREIRGDGQNKNKNKKIQIN